MNIYKDLPEIDVQFFQQSINSPNIDHQGIQWPFIEQRQAHLKKRATNYINQNHSPVYKKRDIFPTSKPIYKDQFYKTYGFHKVPETKESHFQSKYTLVKPQIPNILIHSQLDKLIIYDKFQQFYKRFQLCRPGFESIGIAALKNRIVVAGMSANLIIIDIESGLQNYNEILGEYQFINHAFMYEDFLVTCDNAKKIKIYDLEKSSQQPIYCYKDQANINLACVSSERLIGYCGDRLGVSVLDPKSNQLIHNLKHHTDYAFCVDFNPTKPYELASGSEDLSCLIYDLRNTQQPLQQIESNYAIYNLQYTPCGRYLVIGESQDYLHIIDNTYQHMQTVTFFGRQTGIAMDQDVLNTFYFSVDYPQHSGIFEMNL